MDIKWPWWEVPLLNPTIHVQGLACALCLSLTFSWWCFRHHKTVPAGCDSEQRDNGCNNPNCLRCHSSSRHHTNAFNANVTMLRRLVKLEPDLFAGLRKEIWSAIEDMERQFEHQNDIPPGLFIGFIKSMEGCWERWRKMYSDETTKSGGTRTASMPLSPQQGQNPTVFFVPGLEAIPLHGFNRCREKCPCVRLWKSMPISKNAPPIPVTGDVEALQKNYRTIRRELLDYLSSDRRSSDPFEPFDPEVYTRASTASSRIGDAREDERPEWSSIYLYRQGVRQSRACDEYFPRTARALEAKCPHLMAGKCGFGSVYFSKLERNTKVKEHCGPTNVRWRCHLPLVVPKGIGAEGDSRLRVGLPGVNEKCVGWEEGVPILFDDSFLHSAVHHGVINTDDDNSDSSANNDMGGARIVLIVDLWHPSLSGSDRTALGVLYPPGS